MQAGAATLKLMADISDLKAKMAEVERITQQASGRATSGFQGMQLAAARGFGGLLAAAGTAATAIAGVVAVVGTLGFALKGIRDLDAFNDVADSTGATIEQLAKLERIARLNGGTLETVQTALLKLNKGLSEGDADSPTAIALEAIGLNAEKLKQLDPAVALNQVAASLAGYADNGNKARIIQELFGKSTKELASFLKDAAAGGGENAKVIAEQTEKAEAFQKQLAAFKTGIEDIGRALSITLLPAANAVIGAMNTLFGSQTQQQQAQDLIDRLTKQEIILARIQDEVDDPSTGNAKRQARTKDLEKQLALVQGLRKEVEKLQSAQPKTPDEPLKIAGDTDVIKKRKDELKELAKLEADRLKAYKALTASIDERIATQGMELSGNEKLSESQKVMLQIQREMLAGSLKLNASELEQVYNRIDALKVLEGRAAAEKELQTAREALLAATQKVTDAGLQELAAIEKTNRALELEAEEIGLTKQALAELTAARLRDNAAILEAQGLQADDEVKLRQAQALRRQAELIVANEAKRANVDAAEQSRQEWIKTFEQLGEALTAEIMRGGKNAGRLLKDYFKTLVLQPVIKAIVNPIAAGLTGALGFGSTAAQAGQGASALGNLGSLASIGSSVGAFGSSFAAGFTSTISSGFATTGLALEGGLAMVAEGTMASMAAGFGQIAGALGPYAIAAAALYGIYKSLDKSGTPHRGGAVTSAGVGFNAVDAFGANRLVQTEATLGPLAQASAQALNMMSALAGGATNLSVALSFAADGVDESIGSINIAGQSIRNLKFSNNIEQAMKELTGELGIGLRSAILSMDLPKWIADQFAMLRVDATVEDVAKLVDSINAQVTATRTLKAAFDGLPGSFAAVANLPDELRLQIVNMFGGAQQAVQAADAYFQAFYSEAERRNAQITRLSDAFKALGQPMPALERDMNGVVKNGEAARAEFRKLVDSLSLADEKSRATYVALIGLSGAFAEVTPSLEKAAAAAAELARSAEEIARERLGLERELLQLQGNTAALRARERAELDDSNRALYDQIQALKDQQAATQAATQAADALAASLERIAQERIGLESRLLQATGQTAALRLRELAALDSSNVALLEQVFLAEDTAAALDEARQAQAAYNAELADAKSKLDAARAAVDSAQGRVEAIQDRATGNYISALERVNQLQEGAAQAARQVAFEYGRLADNLFGYVRGQTSGPSEQFGAALTRALAGDRDAMSSLPGLADTAIESSSASAGTAAEAAIARARVLADVQRVAEIANAQRATEVDAAAQAQAELIEAQADLAEALRVANAIGAPLVAKQEDLIAEFAIASKELTDANEALDKAQAALDSIAKNTAAAVLALQGVSEEVKALAFSGIIKADALIKFVADATDLPDDLRALALATGNTFRKTIDFVLGSDDLSDALKQIALAQTNTITKTVRAVLSDDSSEAVKRLVVQQGGAYAATIQAIASADLTDAQRRVLFAGGGSYLTTVNAILESGIDDNAKRLALDTTGAILKTINAQFDPAISAEAKALALAGNTGLSRLVSASLSPSVDPTARTLALQASSDLVRTVNAIQASGMDQEAKNLALKGADTLSRTVALALGNVNTDAKTFAQLAASLGTSTRSIDLARGTFNSDADAVRALGTTLVTATKYVDLLNGNFSAEANAVRTMASDLGRSVRSVDLAMGTSSAAANEVIGYAANLGTSTKYVDLARGTISQDALDVARIAGGNSSISVNGSIAVTAERSITDLYNGLRDVLFAINQGVWVPTLSAVQSIDSRIANVPQIKFDRGNGSVFAQGGAFTNGIVSRPTAFDMGLMGEAGPEAIMPLSRMPDGSLGVRGMGGSADMSGVESRLERLENALWSIAKHTDRSARSNERLANAVDGDVLVVEMAQ